MKLTKRDIQYVMNEARRIVAEKKGQVDEFAFGRIVKGARAAVQGGMAAAKQAAQQGAY